jgi:hypothetical protein
LPSGNPPPQRITLLDDVSPDRRWCIDQGVRCAIVCRTRGRAKWRRENRAIYPRTVTKHIGDQRATRGLPQTIACRRDALTLPQACDLQPPPPSRSTHGRFAAYLWLHPQPRRTPTSSGPCQRPLPAATHQPARGQRSPVGPRTCRTSTTPRPRRPVSAVFRPTPPLGLVTAPLPAPQQPSPNDHPHRGARQAFRQLEHLTSPERVQQAWTDNAATTLGL